MFDGHTYTDHPAATLTPSERVEAIAYLAFLDEHWTEHGKDGWYTDGLLASKRPRQCLTTYGATGRRPAMMALGFCGPGAAVRFNDAPSTTFAMVHTRVKDTLAVLRGLG